MCPLQMYVCGVYTCMYVYVCGVYTCMYVSICLYICTYVDIPHPTDLGVFLFFGCGYHPSAGDIGGDIDDLTSSQVQILESPLAAEYTL